jgi:hypothetical protein
VGGAQAPPSPLAIVEALFNVGPGVGGRQPLRNSGDDDEEGREDRPGTEMLDDQTETDPRPPPDPKIAASVKRAVQRIEKALLDPDFVDARAPALLGADIGLAAILLVMGLAAGHIEVEVFRETTRRLWGGLFFGRGIQLGTVPERLLAQDDQDTFLQEFASPRLAAALSLWCVTEWSAQDRDALWFRLSAAQLQARWPFLFAAGDPDVMASELQAMSAALLPPNEQAECARTWRDVVRAGKALELLTDSLKKGPRDVLQRVSVNLWLEPGDLVWAGNTLAFPAVRIRHEASVNIPVRPLGAAKETKYRGGFVFPVRGLLEAGVLDLSPAALPEIRRLVGDFERAEPAVAA